MSFNQLILSLFSISFTTLSAVCFAKPLIKTKKEMEILSATYWDFNPHMMDMLKRDRQCAFIGLSLLALGVTLQILSIVL